MSYLAQVQTLTNKNGAKIQAQVWRNKRNTIGYVYDGNDFKSPKEYLETEHLSYLLGKREQRVGKGR